MNLLSTNVAAGLSLLALAFSGCQTAAPTRVTDYSAPATVSEPTPSKSWSAVEEIEPVAPIIEEEAVATTVIFKSQQIEVTKLLLEDASVGGDLKYRIFIEALDEVQNVRVAETIPAGIKFKSADPAATLDGNIFSWLFPSMSLGDTQDITVTVKPQDEGDHMICSTVSVENTFCLNIFAGQPQLAVVKEGPSSVELGEEAVWTVSVTNEGSAVASNVIVTDTLPESFTPTSSLRQSVGDLAPGESATVTYSAKAVKQGSFQNRAVATYDSSGPEGRGSAGTSPEASIPIAIVQSGIRVTKSGPEEAYVFKPEVFKITIENTGDTDLENVWITDLLPEGSSIFDPGRGRVSDNAIGWLIPNLPAGASQLITTEIAATRTGESTNTVKLLSETGLEASDSVTTKWLAVPGVTVSITDSKDPIRIGEPTTYTIQVRNQGDFEPVSGTITVAFSDGIKPTEVAGDAVGTIDGQTVTFPRTTLEPSKDTNLSITAEGNNIGAGRAIMKFSADFLTDPIISQEATNVY